MKTIFNTFLLLCIALGSAAAYWISQPIIAPGQKAIEFSITPGSGIVGASQEIADAGVPIQPLLFALLARGSGKGNRIKAGSYELEPGATPLRLLEQLVRGEFAQASLTIIEGWSFKQMRQAVAAHKNLKHDTVECWPKSLAISVRRRACFSRILICLPRVSATCKFTARLIRS